MDSLEKLQKEYEEKSMGAAREVKEAIDQLFLEGYSAIGISSILRRAQHASGCSYIAEAARLSRNEKE